MARGQYIRGDKGRFAGSMGGGGSRGSKGGGAGGGGGKLAVPKARLRGHEIRTTGGHGARHFQTQGKGAVTRRATVTRIHKGQLVDPGAVRGRIASQGIGRVGSPINGNKNLRYVAPSNIISRSAGYLNPAARGVGRVGSRQGARHINQGRMPKSGYIVAYPTRSGR